MINGTDYYRRYEPLFGEWRIDELIGEGSSGEVFRITKTDSDGIRRTEALKAICIPKSETEFKMLRHDGFTPESARSYLQDVAANIVREYSLMAQMSGNPHIVGYRDHVTFRHENGIGWDILIRMELLTPISDYFETKELTVRDIIKLGIHICRALELCHGCNVIHRDIKPENIFADGNGNFKLGDFGIAREVEKTQAGLTKTGTITYMAPEVFKGDPYGKTIDIYSLGIVLYKFVNHNRIPFSPRYPEPVTYDSRDAANMARMRGEKIPYPDGTSFREFADIILKACSYKPEDRFSSATEMRTALESLLTGKPSQADFDNSAPGHVELIDNGTNAGAFGKASDSSVIIPEISMPSPLVPDKREEITPKSARKKSFFDNKVAVVFSVLIPTAVIIAVILLIYFTFGSAGKSKKSTTIVGGSGDTMIIDTGAGESTAPTDPVPTVDPAAPITQEDETDPTPAQQDSKYGNKITSVKYNASITFTIYEDKSGDTTLVVSGVGSIDNYDISGPKATTCIPESIKNVHFTKLVIEPGIETVGECAFYGCTAIREADISAKNIEKFAFAGCTNLRKVTMCSGVEIVRNFAFNNCINITELTFPESIREIYNCADGCSSLKKITVKNYNAAFKISTKGAGDRSISAIDTNPDYKLLNGCDPNLVFALLKSDGKKNTQAYTSLLNLYKGKIPYDIIDP